jgi:glucose/mannose-6-phosphate isomerase
MTTAVGASPLDLDSQGMWAQAVGLPEQLGAAVQVLRPEHRSWLRARAEAGIDNVVVAGMGGSGIVGDVVAGVAGPSMPAPVTVLKGYRLPAFVGPRTMVVAVSCSGDTEETLAVTQAARRAGASVLTVSSGGALAVLASEAGDAWLPVPGDIPQPRAAVGAMCVPVLLALEAAGLLPGAADQVRAAVRQLERRRDALVQPGSAAVAVARRIGRTIPLVHGAEGLTAVAAQRWRTQVNENAKAPAFASVQPELCHNEIAGWGQHGDVTRQVITVVQLRSPDDHPQIARRFDLEAEILREVVGDVVEVWAQGEGPLAQFFDLALIGDLVSLHLAQHEGIDPGPIPVLGEMKAQLAAPAPGG